MMEPGPAGFPDLSGPVETILAALAVRRDAWLIAVTGIPGCGKTTLCEALRERLPASAVLPMDGYHIPRSQLTTEDMRRRGAPHTFDAAAFRNDLVNLRRTRTGRFPAFDHAVKDPEPDVIRIGPENGPVFVEGLYLLLRAWNLGSLFDFTIFLEVDPAEAKARLMHRHMTSGICAHAAEAERRVEENDLPNARLIVADGVPERADLFIRSSPPEPTPAS